jgi:hypothetical protein
VCYDAGRVLDGLNWRPVFDPAEVHRELEIIRDELHCNAVRICGRDVDRLLAASRDALEGATFAERIQNPRLIEQIRAGTHDAPLNEFLGRAADAVRAVFAGPLTYASVFMEAVDWSRFDFVAVDLYRDRHIRDRFRDILGRYLSIGKPVAIAEFGCCTYAGAADAGGMGWAVIDDSTVPPRIEDGLVRDEHAQAEELVDLLGIYDAAGVDATFVFVFSSPVNAYSDDPRYDFDMANYALVKSYGNRLGDAATTYPPLAAALPHLPWDPTRSGTTFPDMPWEPKEAFHAVARFHAAQAS